MTPVLRRELRSIHREVASDSSSLPPGGANVVRARSPSPAKKATTFPISSLDQVAEAVRTVEHRTRQDPQ